MNETQPIPLTDLRNILTNMRHQYSHHYSMGSESGVKIYKLNQIYVCFETPLFGGTETYLGTYGNIDQVIEIINSLT